MEMSFGRFLFSIYRDSSNFFAFRKYDNALVAVIFSLCFQLYWQATSQALAEVISKGEQMRHKVSKIAANGKLVPVTEVICDGYIVKSYTVHFFEYAKKRWFREPEIEFTTTLVFDSAFVVERA